MDIHQQIVVILDFGSQYTQLIARRVREQGVYCEILPFDIDQARLTALNPRGVILSGGPESVTVEEAPKIPEFIFELACPILGICYGMQAMVQQQGGIVEVSDKREFGFAKVVVEESCGLFANIEDGKDEQDNPYLNVWMSHGDKVKSLPNTFINLASSKNAPYVAIMHKTKPWYGLQFHPEVTHTQSGKQILEHFLYDICSCESIWLPTNIIEDITVSVREQVGSDRVLLGLSGGVDSSVVAALLHEAIGSQLTCIFVDNGLLRKNEARQVMETFDKHMGVHVIHVDASQQFLSALNGIVDPEEKRKIVGRLFIEVFEAEANKLDGVQWLAQGTIYPDVVESAGTKFGKSHVIKSHHNVGGLPEHMNLKLLEPLRELFKDEVRKVGVALGLPSDMVHRHPFPGPGLAVRILGEITPEAISITQAADEIFIDELRRHDLYHHVSQAFAVFLPVKSVGVKGDGRTFDYIIALRAVETTDFMTATWAHLPHEFLSTVSSRIINEVNGVSRVVYDISDKPPATIEFL